MIAREIDSLSELSGMHCGAFQHLLVGSKVDSETFLEAVVYNVPDNFCWIVTHISLRSVPEPNDPDLTPGDWRSEDFDASGLATAFWLVSENNATSPEETYFAMINKPVLYLFPGNTTVTLQINPSGGAVPQGQPIVVAINGYLAPPRVIDCLRPRTSNDLAECFISAFGDFTVGTVNGQQLVDILEDNQVVYVATRLVSGSEGKVRIFRVANHILNPAGTYLIGNTTNDEPRIGTLCKSGNTLFVANDNPAARRIIAINVSDPDSPTLAGNLALGLGNVVKRLIAVGSRLYAKTDSQFLIIDASNPGAMAILGTHALNGAEADVVGTTAYIVNDTTGDFATYDVSNPVVITPALGTVNLGGALSTEESFLKAVGGTRAYIVYNRVLKIIDVSNPAAPTVLTSIPIENSDSSSINLDATATKVVITRDLAQTMMLFNVEEAEAPQITATFNEGLVVRFGSDGGIYVGSNDTNARAHAEVYLQTC
jgi:hypothetical protein